MEIEMCRRFSGIPTDFRWLPKTPEAAASDSGAAAQRVKKASQSLPPAGGKGILILDLQYKCNK